MVVKLILGKKTERTKTLFYNACSIKGTQRNGVGEDLSRESQGKTGVSSVHKRVGAELHPMNFSCRVLIIQKNLQLLHAMKRKFCFIVQSDHLQIDFEVFAPHQYGVGHRRHS